MRVCGRERERERERERGKRRESTGIRQVMCVAKCCSRLAKIVRDIREEGGVGSRRRPRRTAVYLAFLQSPWGALRSAWVLQKNAACADRVQKCAFPNDFKHCIVGVDVRAREDGMDVANGELVASGPLCHVKFMHASPWTSTLNSSASSPLQHAGFSERGRCVLPTSVACCCDEGNGWVELSALYLLWAPWLGIAGLCNHWQSAERWCVKLVSSSPMPTACSASHFSYEGPGPPSPPRGCTHMPAAHAHA